MDDRWRLTSTTLWLAACFFGSPVLSDTEAGDKTVEDLAAPIRRTDMIMDAMVGHANGQPIYVLTVFGDIESSLVQLGESVTREAFRVRAGELIRKRLGGIVAERLLIGEAERDLSETEQAALGNVLKEMREQVIREFGAGVPIQADLRLRNEIGLSLDQKMEESRQRLVVERFVVRKLGPKINVSRRDIERYYRDHIDEFQSPPGRILRLIRVGTTAEAEKVDRLLADGTPFVEVASLNINRSNSDNGGLFSDKPVTGNKIFSIDILNAALLELEPNEHSSRIVVGRGFMWIFLEAESQGESKSLRDAQLKIHDRLRYAQLQELTIGYNEELSRTGSYDNKVKMAHTLLEIAMNRYARTK